MDFLQQLMQQLGQANPQQRGGRPAPLNASPVGNKDSWNVNDPRAIRQPRQNVPALNASPAGNIDSWDANDPRAMYPPARPVDPARFGFAEDVGQYGGMQPYEREAMTQPRLRQQPFKMYEDGSFQGNPQAFRATNPGTKFYEDNTFSNPAPQAQKDPIAQLRQLLGF
jgi:hypothetical protein